MNFNLWNLSPFTAGSWSDQWFWMGLFGAFEGLVILIAHLFDKRAKKRILTILLLCICLRAEATTFTEFYVIKGTGTNVNSGSTPDANPTFSASSGNWTNATWTFFKTSLNPVTGGVTNGAWASICTNLTSTNAWLVGMVTNASDTTDTIQLSQVAFMGVNPADRVSDVFIRVGGCWGGPNTNTMVNGGGFPFAFLATTATNAPNVFPRCNFKSGTTYSISNAITHALVGPSIFQGYTSSPGDGGKATFDGGNPATSYLMLLISANNVDLRDFIFDHNGSGGSANGAQVSGSKCNIFRCTFRNMARFGLFMNGTSTLEEGEAYGCNTTLAANQAGFSIGSGTIIRTLAHHNSAGSTSGFLISGGAVLIGSISFSNSKDGATVSSVGANYFIGNDFYNNGAAGVDGTGATAASLEFLNCNFVKNTTFGITSSGSSLRNGSIFSCGFGSGTQTNSSGSMASNLGGLIESGSITYSADVTPWADPANGDFRITLAEAKAMGRGSYTYYGTNAPTIGYPDIGAAQSASTNATTRAFGFSQ